ncbi:MAG: glycolate oxidase subunit GlcF [Chromatiaceae bacterium]|nr:glycolate oxidase subunit GlcF [Chromatiaceae bacterium]
MQTALPATFLATPEGEEANQILRNCVHCGFCTATCPTYQLLGDELDGPRGRIYLVKQMLEGQPASHITQHHLDRCLLCRACETTCPSGVDYHRLLEIGRVQLAARVNRPLAQVLVRHGLRRILPYPGRFGLLLRLGQLVRPLLPAAIKVKVPPRRQAAALPDSQHPRRVILLQGCAQPAAAPNTNAATARVLHRLGISVVTPRGQGCCGAVSQHLAAEKEAVAFMRRNIDAWWPLIEAGAEAVLITASGCGSMVKEYGHLLRNDPEYKDKARRVSAITCDLAEILIRENLEHLKLEVDPAPVGYHSPCSLQHGQQLTGVVEQLLRRLGFNLTPVPDSHLCCGSAGTYSILQPVISQKLLHNKLLALQAGKPTVIATANIGCQLHLETQAEVPVRHWIELVDEAMPLESSTPA